MPVKFEFPFAQGSHIIAFTCAIAVGITMSPLNNLFNTGEGTIAIAMRLVHLASFSGWFGAQLWVTFFAGLTMFRNLPRHTFGYIQSKLFPKYFKLGTVLSCIALVTFVLEYPIGNWDLTQRIQGFILAGSLLTVLANLLYITPSSTSVMFEMHKFEKKIGAGKAEGKVESDKLIILKKDPEYNALYKRFYRLHAAASIGNLLTFCAQGVHLVYLASNMSSL